MTDIRQILRDVHEGSTTPNEAFREVCRLKAEAVVTMWSEYPGKNLEGVATFQTRSGSTAIGAMDHSVDEETGLDAVEVWKGPRQGPPAFRITNPPMLVLDPNGPVFLTERNLSTQTDVIVRYRIDPLQSIAEAIS